MNLKETLRAHSQRDSLSSERRAELRRMLVQCEDWQEGAECDPAECDPGEERPAQKSSVERGSEESACAVGSSVEEKTSWRLSSVPWRWKMLSVMGACASFAVGAFVFSLEKSAVQEMKPDIGFDRVPNRALDRKSDISQVLDLPPSAMNQLPPDFDLGGNGDVLPLFTKPMQLDVSFPVELEGQYKPGSGRFFFWDDRPAVALSLEEPAPTNVGNVKESSSKEKRKKKTLYIVKPRPERLSEFPTVVPQQHTIPGATDVWRSGDTGYVLTGGD